MAQIKGEKTRVAKSPKADAWDKIASQSPDQTLANRDVFMSQQLDRSKIQAREGRKGRMIATIILSVVIFLITWVALSLIGYAVHFLGGIVNPDAVPTEEPGVVAALIWPDLWKIGLSLFSALIAFGVAYVMLMRNLDAQNLMNDTMDINQYQGDQHIALPDEIVRKFDWFPDVGAHSSVQVSSMISHVMLLNKGLKKIRVARRADSDILDADGEIEYIKGEVLLDKNDEPIFDELPMIDEKFGEALFDTSGMPQDKKLRRRFDTTSIKYNPDGTDRNKWGTHKSVADLINTDWDFPEYEVQRPAGAYLVDTAPVNTMVLAITRAGKGQTYIEPMIDMWLREKHPNNMVINDPKGELLVKHYVRATLRGFQVVQFNLINAMKTDIYNPLGLAAEAAREGDIIKCAQYVENIAEVFFPTDSGDDPFWSNAAKNAFKRVAYGLIDFYMEEERKLRAEAERENMHPKVLETRLDEMWGKVTLYNCYQLFVQLTSKKQKNPMTQLEADYKAGKYGDEEEGTFEEERYATDREAALEREPFWNGAPETDLLSLYFSATEQLPTNSIRTLIMNANNSLKSMGGADKTIATVYGIAITEMSFFTDPTIMRLTSGTPSQNTDLGGLSFPRRFGVRFSPDYLTREHIIGTQARWEAFAGGSFTQSLGEDFYHEDTVSPEGWARYYFVGKFASQTAYLKLELCNAQTGLLIKTFYFQFTKDHQTSLSGRYYVTDPVTGNKLVKNGVLVELKQNVETGVYEPGHTTFPQLRLSTKPEDGTSGEPVKITAPSRAITQMMVRYSEAPKAVFLVTPPHLMKYAKLLLILIKQLVDLNFDKSYMTKSSQKPLYKTRFMLDELGNLQSEGHGIAGFETMLSIGLGQEQQFTIILQTLQQLRDVYGESVDKIVQGNCLPLDAKILTPTGWTTMGKIEPGDQLMTPFGTVTSVTDKYPVKVRPVYRLTLRDGSRVEACSDHLWPIERWKSSIQYGGNKGGRTMERVTEIISTKQLKERVEKGRQVELISIDPVAYLEVDLLIDPYVLGAILGDAHIEPKGEVSLFSDDIEVIEEIRRRGYDVVLREALSGRCPRYRINGVHGIMCELGIAGKHSWEKSIPEAYLRGSVEQRIDLLRGLMDTDGTISKKGEMEFTSASRELAEGVQELVRSLGGRVSINVKTNLTYTSPNQATPKRGRDTYRVQEIRLLKINPFLLPRKAQHWRDHTRSFNRVVSVEYVRDDQVQCISVEDDRHLYITDDFIPTHNTSNIVFLKSTDDSMLDTLQKMSGTRHVVYRDSKTVTKDVEKIIKLGSIEGKVSYTMTAKEEPVISYNDMAFISERNSILFRAGDAPVWNRNETILPMSWRLFKDTIMHPGHEYSLQSIPTLSSVADYDVRRNQPDFFRMLENRIEQAIHASRAKEQYRKAFGYTEVDIARLDPDVYSDSVMDLINEMIANSWVDVTELPNMDEGTGWMQMPSFMEYEENMEQQQAILAAEQQQAEKQLKRYAEGMLSREDLGPALDRYVIDTYVACASDMHASMHNFSTGADGSLRSANGMLTYISKVSGSEMYWQMEQQAEHTEGRVFAEEGAVSQIAGAPMASWEVSDQFYHYLASLASWQDIAGGEFDRLMAGFLRQKEAETLDA